MSKHNPAPKNQAELEAMETITVADLIATLSTYPPEHTVFLTPAGALSIPNGLGAWLVVSENLDAAGYVAFSVTRQDGERLTDLEDQQ